MYASDDYDDPIERDRGAFVARHDHDHPNDADYDPNVDDEDQDANLGEGRDPELWSKQIPLIEEDVDDGLKLDDFPEEDIPSIIDAMGDEAAEQVPESPNGVSATGSESPMTPDHGGFPERE